MMKSRSVLIGALIGAALFFAPRGAATAKRPLFLYVDDPATVHRVWGYQVDAHGSLTPVPGSPFSAGSSSDFGSGGLAFLPQRKLLFASTQHGISVFHVAANGALALVAGSPFGGTLGADIGVVRKGARTFVYSPQPTADSIAEFELQADSTLAPLPGSPFSTGSSSGPFGAAVSKDVLVVALPNGHGIASFKAQNDGALQPAPGSPVHLDADDNYQVAIDSTGKYVYTPDANAPQIFGLKINRANGALAPLAGSPYPVTGPDGMDGAIVTGKGPVLFAMAGGNAPNVQAYRKSGNGRLTRLGGLQDPGFGTASGAAIDPSGKILAIVGQTPYGIRTFSFRSSGVITPLDARLDSFGADPRTTLFAEP